MSHRRHVLAFLALVAATVYVTTPILSRHAAADMPGMPPTSCSPEDIQQWISRTDRHPEYSGSEQLPHGPAECQTAPSGQVSPSHPSSTDRISQRRTGSAISTQVTRGSWGCQDLYSWASYLHSVTDGREKADLTETHCQPIRKRSCLSDHRHPYLVVNDHSTRRVQIGLPSTATTKGIQPLVTPRAVSTTKQKFETTDRYLARRNRLDLTSSPLRTSRALLCEKMSHPFECSVQLFRLNNEARSHAAVVLPETGQRSLPMRPPHYTPGFAIEIMPAQPRTSLTSALNPARRSVGHNFWTTSIQEFDSVFGQTHSGEVGTGFNLASTSFAPMLDTEFVNRPTQKDVIDRHERRLATALEIDQARRVLIMADEDLEDQVPLSRFKKVVWKNNIWIRSDFSPVEWRHKFSTPNRPCKAVPNIAFRVLDAPRLKDDYYCSVLAYSRSFRTLAVALTHRVYLWTEREGVRIPPIQTTRPTNYVLSLSFSSDFGSKGILAIARNSGQVTLWGLSDPRPRIELEHKNAVSCVSFNPKPIRRTSFDGKPGVECEELLVGDDNGQIFYYSVEWSRSSAGTATLLAKIDAHKQNICGLAWSSDGSSFATGSNDNKAAFFVIRDLLPDCERADPSRQARDADGIFGKVETISQVARVSGSNRINTHPTPPPSPALNIRNEHKSGAKPQATGLANAHRYIFQHSAAVKAVAFAPWQPTLLATGGGSNDRQIRFHHTGSGTTLAVINVFAQVTSLV